MAVNATYNLPDTLSEGGGPFQVNISLQITETSSVNNFQFRWVSNRQFEFSLDGINWTTEGVSLYRGEPLGAGTYNYVAYIRAFDDSQVEGTHSGLAQLIAFTTVDSRPTLVFDARPSITILDRVPNTAPTDIALSANTIPEKVTVGTGVKIGDITITDPNPSGNNNILSLEGADAASFAIVNGKELYYIGSSPDFESQPSYSLTLKSTDANGGTPLVFSKTFTVNVTDVNEAPTVTDEAVSTRANTAVTVDLSDNLTDPDVNGLVGATLNVTSSTGGTTSIDSNTRQATFTPTTDFSGTASFQYTLTDAGGLASNIATVTVAVAPTPAPTPTPTPTPTPLPPADGELGTALPPIRFNGGQPGLRRKGTNRNDTLRGSSKNDILLGLGGNDKLLSGSKNFRFGRDQLLGGAGDDLLVSGAGNDLLDGGSGNDRLKAGRGNDLLLGGEGNDRLWGDAGDDVITGGTGTDTSRGGAGRDTFVFNTPSEGSDVIQDFEGTADLIDLRTIFAQAAFSGATPFARYQQFIRLVQVGSDTAVQIDADGNGAGSDFTTLVNLSNVALSVVSSKNFVIT